MSALVEQMMAWCAADGMACAVESDNADAMALTIAAPKLLESWVTVHRADERSDQLRIEYRDHPTVEHPREELAAIAERVALARPGLVECAVEDGTSATFVTSVTIYTDGLTQQVLMATLDEIRKTVAQLRDELRAAEEYDGLLDDTRTLLNGLEETLAAIGETEAGE